MIPAKQELRGEVVTSAGATLDLAEEDMAAAARKRRAAEQELSPSSSTTTSYPVGSYLLQSSSGAIAASPNVWMVTNSSNQVMSGDPIWTFPTNLNNVNSALYRGATMSSGLHFMNFPTPMALLPSQQLGSGGGGGGGGMGEGHLGMLAGINPYRTVSGVSESQASGSQSHHGGDDRHDTNSHRS